MDRTEPAKLTLVKVGGAVVEDPASLDVLLHDFARLSGAKVLVHGGGRAATRIASRLGIESRMVGGRRVTDADMLEVVTMVYGGLVNKNIVARLYALGLPAVGLTGADGGYMLSHRRPAEPVDYGFVGDVERTDPSLLALLVEQGYLPVLAPLTHDGHGTMLNTNADTIASSAACALAQSFDVTLVYCFEMLGVLRDPSDEQSVIPRITPALYETLKADGTVSGGMLPKLDNAFAALRSGVGRVLITRADRLADPSSGTLITL